jgi:hypothetical protein
MNMSEGFLARWSRRKLAQTESPPEAAVEPDNNGPAEGELPESPMRAESKEATPDAQDLDLPPLESIGPGSDVRAFLRAGVPAALSRAALRRAWAADPAIRDFVGLAENSWDFTKPGQIPGFNAIAPNEVKELLARYLDDGGSSKTKPPSPDAAEPASIPERERQNNPPDKDGPEQAAQIAAAHTKEADVPDDEPAGDEAGTSPRAAHGSALPE